MRVIYLSDTAQKPRLLCIDGDEVSISKLVDGSPAYLCTADYGDTTVLGDYEIWYGDESRFRRDINLNFLITEDRTYINHQIRGPIFISKSDEEGEFMDVDEEDLSKIRKEIEKRILINDARKKHHELHRQTN